MLALFVHGSQAFTGPTMHIAPQPTVRSSPVQMAEMSSRRAALLSAATLAVPFAASAATPFYKVNKAGISRPQGNKCDVTKPCTAGAGLKWDSAALGVKAAEKRTFTKTPKGVPPAPPPPPPPPKAE